MKKKSKKGHRGRRAKIRKEHRAIKQELIMSQKEEPSRTLLGKKYRLNLDRRGGARKKKRRNPNKQRRWIRERSSTIRDTKIGEIRGKPKI